MKHAVRLRYQLGRLNNAEFIKDMDFSGYDLHQLKDKLKGALVCENFRQLAAALPF